MVLDFRNNVIYNWGRKAGTISGEYGKTMINMVGNYYKIGRDSQTKCIFLEEVLQSRSYVQGNCMNGSYPEDPWSLVCFSDVFSDKQITFILTSASHRIR